MSKTLFAGYPTALIYELGSGSAPPKKLKAAKQLLWGDWMQVLGKSANGDFFRVRSRGVEGWIRSEETQKERILEVVFVDIGQGDGALVVTPDDRKYVIDAGQGDNMYRFLRWRFGFKTPIDFDAAIISHSDSDHYGGFEELFAEPNAKFKCVYTNGIMERASKSASLSLGKPVKKNGKKYIASLVRNKAELLEFLGEPARWSKKKYPTMLAKAVKAGRFKQYRMLDASVRFLPGHGESDSFPIEVLGPCAEEVGEQSGLRWFGSVGKTKNGHSIVLRAKLGNLRLFMGGDLNLESSRWLLESHTGLSGSPKSAEAERELVEAGRAVFECDVAKACHHGSADTLLALLRSINPVATVVSSGDDEPHAHPRADALGAIAKSSRGDRPLILSTELARSAKEQVKQPQALRSQLNELAQAIANASTPAKRAIAQKKFDALTAKIDRSVAVYGAINLRSDGDRVVLAYMLERSTSRKKWDVYCLEPTGRAGALTYKSKYD